MGRSTNQINGNDPMNKRQEWAEDSPLQGSENSRNLRRAGAVVLRVLGARRPVSPLTQDGPARSDAGGAPPSSFITWGRVHVQAVARQISVRRKFKETCFWEQRSRRL